MKSWWNIFNATIKSIRSWWNSLTEAQSIIIAAIIGGIFVLVGAWMGSLSGNNSPTTPEPTIAITVVQSTATETPSVTPSPTETLSATEIEETIRAEMVTIQAEQRHTQIAIETTVAEAERLATVATANALTQIAESWTYTPTPNLRATAEARSTIDAQSTLDAQATADAQQTQFAAVATVNYFATLNARQTQRAIIIMTTTLESDPFALAERGVTSNAEWQRFNPHVQLLNDVEMLLVPAGCFDMGSENGDSDERPVFQYCFNSPFWIDRYEVSNAQFAHFGGLAANAGRWPEANFPRTLITWAEAYNFCEKRDARLPTEAEWEFAARGPDNLTYPWGNEFNGENLNFCDINCGEDWADNTNDGYQFTAPVNAFARGTSWIGAFQMSGNVWEWVSTIYNKFPYVESDGREARNATNILRVLRGGSWYYTSFYSRATFRFENSPSALFNTFGFRCARDYESE